MNKISCFIYLMLLFLSGCGRADVAPLTGASVTNFPSDAGSPSTVVPFGEAETEELTWGINFGMEDIVLDDLPRENAKPDQFGVSSRTEPIFLLASVEKADIRLYGLNTPKEYGILLRKGDVLQYFQQTYGVQDGVLPELQWEDLDADGQSELVARYFIDNRDGKAVYELHIYEPGQDGWTDHGLTPEVYRPLLEDLIHYRYDEELSTVTISMEQLSTSIWYGDEMMPTGLAPLGDLVFFRSKENRFQIVFGLRLETEGARVDIATLTADLNYDGQGFSLQNYELTPLGGV